jgi:hypothetical protein
MFACTRPLYANASSPSSRPASMTARSPGGSAFPEPRSEIGVGRSTFGVSHTCAARVAGALRRAWSSHAPTTPSCSACTSATGISPRWIAPSGSGSRSTQGTRHRLRDRSAARALLFRQTGSAELRSMAGQRSWWACTAVTSRASFRSTAPARSTSATSRSRNGRPPSSAPHRLRSYVGASAPTDACSSTERAGTSICRVTSAISSSDIRQLFVDACRLVGVDCRPAGPYVRINRRESVQVLLEQVGLKS